jgi:two-component system, cell cycle response regulator DivK
MKPRRILLVDDYPDALEMWGLYLRSLGYDVSTADDGLTAMEMALAVVPDVIVMDLELPGITGFEAARRLRQHARTARVPLIAATGYSHSKQLDQARQAGFDSVIVKPCDPGALVAEIERCLSAAGKPARAAERPVPSARPL